MVYDEDYFETLWGKSIKVTFLDHRSMTGVFDGYLPKHDNEYDAILIMKEKNLIEIKVEDIKGIQIL